MQNSTPSPSAALSASELPSTRLGLFTKGAALVPSLCLAGSLVAQSDTTSTSPADTAPSPTQPSEGSVVELPKFNVEEHAPIGLSSPKFTAAPVDTPQTVVVIPQEVYTAQAATNLSDVLRNTPGITFTAGENGNVGAGDSFHLRGFDTSNSIFIDGVRDSGAYSRDIYNIEQVEIAKGPASDNGRSAAGGYVNLQTKSPTLQNFIAGTASYGFDETDAKDRYRGTLDANFVLGDTLLAGTAFRLNALWQEGGVAGREIAENNRWGVSPSLAFGLGTPTRLVLSYEHFEQRNIPDWGVPSLVIPEIHDSTKLDPLPGRIDRDAFFGLRSDYDDVTSDSFLARIEHDITPDLQVSNQTKYTFTQREGLYTSLIYQFPTPPVTAPNVTANRSRQAFDRTNQILSNTTNLSATFDTGFVEHTLATGLELTREQAYTRKFTGLGTLAPNSIFNPDPDAPLTGFAPIRNGFTDTQIDSAALYLYDTAKLNSWLQLTGGLRVEHYKTELTDLNGTTRIERNDDGTVVSGKFGVVVKPRSNGSVYAAYGNTARPPLTNTLSPNSAGTPSNTGAESDGAKPQRAESFEVGTKWDFLDNRLSTTLALFHTTNKNVSTATDPLTGDPAAYGKQIVQGVELGVTGRITDAWLVFAGVAYLDTENRNPSSATADGADLQWTPEWSGNVWTTYDFPIGLRIGAGVQYMGEARRQTTTAPTNSNVPAEVPDYWTLNAMASYAVNKHLTLRLNVDNVTDELYARSLNNGGGRVYLGAPRTYTISGEFRF